MHRTLRMVAPYDLEIEKILRRQKRRTPQQEEEEVQHIEGIAIELPFEEEMKENEANKRSLIDFALLGI